MFACSGKFKISKFQTATQRGVRAAYQPQDIAFTETNHHARDDITAAVYNYVSRERPVESEQQYRRQSSEDAGHRCK